MSDTPTEELYKELYARFGLTYYHSECVHRELCMILAGLQIPSKHETTRPRVEELFARAFSLSLGDVANALKPRLPADLSPILDQVVTTRNFLAHHFWYERSPQLLRVDDVNGLIAELNEYAALFENVDHLATSLFDAVAEGIGVTDQVLKESYDRVVSGTLLEPLPTKEQMRGLDRKLKGSIKLTKVWVVPTGNNKEPLVFQEESDTLWQLCDIGLGWTLFKQVESDWRVQPQIQQHLPASVKPRPVVTNPWDYELELGNQVVMIVKPGKELGTFRWELRSKR